MAYDNPFALKLLKGFEGYTAKPKWDHKQYSVGYSTRWTPGTPWGTREDHERDFRNHAGQVDDYINRNVKVPVTPGQRAALTSFGYNLGEGAIGKLLPDINAGNWDRVGQRMMSFTRAGDNPNALVDRRRQEVDVLRGGGNLENTAAGGGEMPISGHKSSRLPLGGPMPAASGGPMPSGGPQPLTAPNMRYSKLADALLASAAGAKPRGLGELLNAAGDLALGYTLSNRADEEQQGYKSQLAERLLATEDADGMAKTLMSTGDDDLVKQGVAMKVAQAKENAPLRGKDRYMALPNGQILDLQTMQPVPGMAAKDDKPIEINGRLVKLNPQTNAYEEVYAAPEKPQKQFSFTKTGIGNEFTGDFKPYEPGQGDDPEVTLERGKYEQGLRKEYTSLTSDLRTINDSMNRMRTASKTNSGAGDMAMVYSYMKMLDPTSVVREGEYATAENTGGVPERIANVYNKVISGQRLTPSQRQEFLTAADALAKEKSDRFGKTRTQFEDIARKSGVDPARIMLDEGLDQTPPSAGAPPNGAAPRLAPGHVEDGFRFKGGDPANPNSWEPVR